MIDVIAVFDIGKTNKKILLFDQNLKLVFQQEQILEEIKDDDGFACDDIDKIEKWMIDTVKNLVAGKEYNIKAVNFATYGASQAYLDENGRRLTPVYNYLKPMPPSVLEGFYDKYGGVEEFCRKTASPAMGMLNSGLQTLWLKKEKPAVYAKVKIVINFPQYLSYCFTGKILSEYTYLGCHTSLWDFDRMQYHTWLKDFGISLPEPMESGITNPIQIEGKKVEIGIGIHDSSASLVPYFTVSKDPFVLLSTGTWFVVMNPFNGEPLTAEQLRSNGLAYLSVYKKPVKSSLLFLGFVHQVNAKNISDFFCVEEDFFKKVKIDEALLKKLLTTDQIFFKKGIPTDHVDKEVDLEQFGTAGEAYHQMVVDLVRIAVDAFKMVLAKDDTTKIVYISGGFARNTIFTRLMATLLPGKKVYTSEIDNATALGAALAIWKNAYGTDAPLTDLGLNEIKAL